MMLVYVSYLDGLGGKNSYLHIDMPSILPRLLEIAERSLNALANHTRVTSCFTRESRENLRQPLGRRALVRERLHQSAQAEHSSMTGEDQTVLLLRRRRGTAGGSVAVLGFLRQGVLDEQVGEVRFELGHLRSTELKRRAADHATQSGGGA